MGAIDFNLLARAYFYFDTPVDFNLDKNTAIKIYPVSVRDSEIFMSSVDILMIDKNSFPDPNVIQMTYLEFLAQQSKNNRLVLDKLGMVLGYCLRLGDLMLAFDERYKYIITNSDKSIVITPKKFEDIRRIILYQNILHFDDEYINPRLKEKMDEYDRIKSKGLVRPNLERRINIITAHCGLSKQEQLDMTYRCHTGLFEEVCGEVEYTTTRPIALYAGKANEMEHWIYPKDKGKFDNYIVSDDKYSKSFNGKPYNN